MGEDAPAASPGRCKRTDGRSWRCKLQRLDDGGGFCEAHYLQKLGRARAGVSAAAAGGDGRGKRRGRPRREAKGFIPEENGGDEQGESLTAGEKDLKRRDSEVFQETAKEDDSGAGKSWEQVYERRRRAKGEDSRVGRDDLGNGSSSLARVSTDSEKCTTQGEMYKGIATPASPPPLASGSMPWDLTRHQCSMRSATDIEIRIDIAPSKRGRTVVEDFDGEYVNFWDNDEKLGENPTSMDAEKVYRRRKRAKEGMKVVDLEVGHSSVAMVLDGFEKGPSHIEKPKEGSVLRECQLVSFPHCKSLQKLYEGYAGEGITNFTSIHSNNLDVGDDENNGRDAVVAPSPSPSSPNIGESTHQLSLPTQTQPQKCKQPPAPSASTSCMYRKKGDQDKVPEVTPENLDIGSGKSMKRAKKTSKSSGKFSISRCATVLNEMTGFTPEELVKASKVFIKSFNREMFLSLRDELRRVWLRDRISG